MMAFNPEKERARQFARILMVQENIVRNRLEFGPPLDASEMMAGVRLSHDEFLFLARAAMAELNRILEPRS